jgi:hypothetical protein
MAVDQRVLRVRLVAGFERLIGAKAQNAAIARHLNESEAETDGKPNRVRIGMLLIWQKQGGNWKLSPCQGYKLT